jgi:hypothetical protein
MVKIHTHEKLLYTPFCEMTEVRFSILDVTEDAYVSFDVPDGVSASLGNLTRDSEKVGENTFMVEKPNDDYEALELTLRVGRDSSDPYREKKTDTLHIEVSSGGETTHHEMEITG